MRQKFGRVICEGHDHAPPSQLQVPPLLHERRIPPLLHLSYCLDLCLPRSYKEF